MQNLNPSLSALIYKDYSENWEADLQRFFSTILNDLGDFRSLIDAENAPHEFIIKTLTGAIRYQISENTSYFENLEELEDCQQGLTVQFGILHIRPDYDDWLIGVDGKRMTSTDILVSDITEVELRALD